MRRNASRNPKAFTLVELLVVIGIIALLISILLPSLGKARRAAQTVQCLSNMRQLSLAAVQFSNDHKGFFQTTTDYGIYVKFVDVSKTRYDYRDDGTLKDWASALLPYLGGKKTDDFSTAATKQTKVFQCPSDRWLDDPAPGYGLVNNIANGSGTLAPPPAHPFTVAYVPISYGVNVDITDILDANGAGRYNPGQTQSVTGGPKDTQNNGAPLGAKLSRIKRATEVLLFADCGTRPFDFTGGTAPVAALNFNDSLAYTTNFSGGYTLGDIALKGYLQRRIPIERHGGNYNASWTPGVVGTAADASLRANGKINVGFADGHGETVLYPFFNKVRVSPY